MRKFHLLLVLFFLTACQSDKSSNQSDFAWQIKVDQYRVADTLSDKTTVTHYDGSSEIVTITHSAESGYAYVLINVQINKAKAGGSAFSWEKLHLVDVKGRQYSRIDDDFLTQHDLDRLPGIELRLGDHIGWIGFEVPIEVSKQKFSLNYQADEGVNTVKVAP